MTEMYGENTARQRRRPGSGTQGRKVRNIRVRTHPDKRFDRVVFDLTGAGEPGWIVAYTDSPSRDGSGNPMQVPSNASLDDILDGIDWTNARVPKYDGDQIKQ